jgi:cell division septation protein DedD
MTIIHAMDRSLKARLIGASVLVLLVVLVVPELLSGRKAATTDKADATVANGQTRTYTIELGQTAAPAATDANLPRQYTPEASPLAAERPARVQTSPRSRRSPRRSPAGNFGCRGRRDRAARVEARDSCT